MDSGHPLPALMNDVIEMVCTWDKDRGKSGEAVMNEEDHSIALDYLDNHKWVFKSVSGAVDSQKNLDRLYNLFKNRISDGVQNFHLLSGWSAFDEILRTREATVEQLAKVRKLEKHDKHVVRAVLVRLRKDGWYKEDECRTVSELLGSCFEVARWNRLASALKISQHRGLHQAPGTGTFFSNPRGARAVAQQMKKCIGNLAIPGLLKQITELSCREVQKTRNSVEQVGRGEVGEWGGGARVQRGCRQES